MTLPFGSWAISFILLLMLTIACDVLELTESSLWTAMKSVDLLWLTVGFAFLISRLGLFKYVMHRLAEAVLTLLAIATLTFFLLRIIPGGPFDSDKSLAPEVMANLESKYHLKDPIALQYWKYLRGFTQGEWGESYYYVDRSVRDIISETLPVSMKLGGYALLFSVFFGVPLGLLAAAKYNTWLDTASMFTAISGVSLPAFLVAPVLILIFSMWLGWFPPAQWEGPLYYILPVITLGLRPAAIIARLIRSSSLDVVRSDFIRTGRAKGLSETRIYFKHVLRNGLVPLLSITGPLTANILSGSFVVELLFNVPGLGKHLIQSVNNRDFPLIMGVTLVYATMLLFANLFSDILLAAADPRIQLE